MNIILSYGARYCWCLVELWGIIVPTTGRTHYLLKSPVIEDFDEQAFCPCRAKQGMRLTALWTFLYLHGLKKWLWSYLKRESSALHDRQRQVFQTRYLSIFMCSETAIMPGIRQRIEGTTTRMRYIKGLSFLLFGASIVFLLYAELGMTIIYIV